MIPPDLTTKPSLSFVALTLFARSLFTPEHLNRQYQTLAFRKLFRIDRLLNRRYDISQDVARVLEKERDVPARIRQCFAVSSGLDKTRCVSESAAASLFARPAVT